MNLIKRKLKTKLKRWITSFTYFTFLSRDADGAIVRPLPRAKRMLSEATCLPHLVQVFGCVVFCASILASNFAFILVPRAHYPSGLRHGSRALAGSKPGSPWITDVRSFYTNSKVLNNSGCQRLQKCTFTATAHTSELTRALDPRRIVDSGDENASFFTNTNR